MASASTICDHCLKDTELETCCIECEEMYCDDCTQYHRRVKATRNHTMVDISNQETDLTHSNIDKECGAECGNPATGICFDCKEILCDDCITKHRELKATKNHTIIAAKVLEPLGETQSQRQRRSSYTSDFRSDMGHAQVPLQRGSYEGRFSDGFKVSAPADKELARVIGIAFLSDSKIWRIVVADYKNRSLKLFNMKYQLVTTKDLKEEPRGIVAISNDKIAATIADKKEIRIFKVDSNKIQSQKSSTIKTKEKPYSIAFNRDYLAVETGETSEDGAIRILHISGREICAITAGSTRSFGQFSGNTIRLELDSQKEQVFVVDISNNRIHCVGFKSIVYWTVPLKTPRGITSFGNTLFVSSSEANIIYQVNATDGMIYQFLDESYNKVKKPRYVAFNPQFKLLAVDMDNSHIKLYQVDRSKTDENV